MKKNKIGDIDIVGYAVSDNVFQDAAKEYKYFDAAENKMNILKKYWEQGGAMSKHITEEEVKRIIAEDRDEIIKILKEGSDDKITIATQKLEKELIDKIISMQSELKNEITTESKSINTRTDDIKWKSYTLATFVVILLSGMIYNTSSKVDVSSTQMQNRLNSQQMSLDSILRYSTSIHLYLSML
jgi:hypothetical protein